MRTKRALNNVKRELEREKIGEKHNIAQKMRLRFENNKKQMIVFWQGKV